MLSKSALLFFDWNFGIIWSKTPFFPLKSSTYAVPIFSPKLERLYTFSELNTFSVHANWNFAHTLALRTSSKQTGKRTLIPIFQNMIPIFQRDWNLGTSGRPEVLFKQSLAERARRHARRQITGIKKFWAKKTQSVDWVESC